MHRTESSILSPAAAYVLFCSQSSGCFPWRSHQARVPHGYNLISRPLFPVQHFLHRSRVCLLNPLIFFPISNFPRLSARAHLLRTHALRPRLPLFSFSSSPSFSFQPPRPPAPRPDQVPTRQNRLRFRIAQPALKLQQPRPRSRPHQINDKSLVTNSVARPPFIVRSTIVFSMVRPQFGRQEFVGRIRDAHAPIPPPCSGLLIVVEYLVYDPVYGAELLVILSVASQQIR